LLENVAVALEDIYERIHQYVIKGIVPRYFDGGKKASGTPVRRVNGLSRGLAVWAKRSKKTAKMC
jgi:hypothetical protein